MYKPTLWYGLVLSWVGISMALQADADIEQWRVSEPIQADVVKVKNFKALSLHLYQSNGEPYATLTHLAKRMRQACQPLSFAMNAGMFHSDYSAVGLYVEDGQQLQALNRATQGYGNFLIQPNGVLAWNDQEVRLQSTAEYAKNTFNPRYATQSGPMLVHQGQINPNFLKDASSYKIRNGVGLKNQQLYFVISNQPVTFYQFATFFKEALGIDDALYLDGSLSSAYIPALNRYDTWRRLGPMLAYSEFEPCQKALVDSN